MIVASCDLQASGGGGHLSALPESERASEKPSAADTGERARGAHVLCQRWRDSAHTHTLVGGRITKARARNHY